MKKYYAFGVAAMALLSTGCSNDQFTDNSVVDNIGKEKIMLSAGDDQAAFTTRAGFTAKTRIVARIVSDSRGGDAAKCVKTVLSAAAEASSAGYSVVSYNEGKTRYWDDAYGRNSILSVYAVAIPNQNDGSDGSNLKETVLKGGDTWAADNATDDKISWTVATTQTTDILANEDLTYSNNIQAGDVGANGVYTWDYTNSKYPEAKPANAIKHTVSGVTDGRLYFTQSAEDALTSVPTDAPGHFDRGQMEFKHSLSRIQVNLIKGEGYTAINAPTSVQLNKMYNTGTFDIKTASWSDKSTVDALNMAKWTTAATDKDATYEAQVLPGYEFTNSNAINALQFSVDGNTYFITNNMLYTALGEKDKTMAMGNRYIFDITVAKAKIQNITATIVDWNDVTAENTTVNNSHVKFTFYEATGTECTKDEINLYKNTQSLGTGVISTDNSYEAAPVSGASYSAVNLVGDAAPYSTDEFYNDNNTAYHFRSINDAAVAGLNGGTSAFTMTSGATDYHWGAPMKSGITSIPYSAENGYTSSIEKGIVAATNESEIKLTEIHMMSQIIVNLTTPNTGAAVDLTDAEVYLTRYKATGEVDMSTGKITPTATITATSDKFPAVTGQTNQYVFNVVPQDLVRVASSESNDDYIGLTIKTKDNNEYYIIKRLSDIVATSVGSQATNQQTKDNKITTWYPGHKYIYTFNITKTEIKNITATIVGWNDVTGANTDLDLEK